MVRIRLVFSSPLGFRVVLRHVRRTTQYFLTHIPRLTEADYVSIKYEELCQDPDAEVAKIMSFLDLAKTNNTDFRGLIRERRMNLLPEVESQRGLVRERLLRYAEYCRYQI